MCNLNGKSIHSDAKFVGAGRKCIPKILNAICNPKIVHASKQKIVNVQKINKCHPKIVNAIQK